MTLRRALVILSCFFCIFALDYVSKWAVVQNLSSTILALQDYPYGGMGVFQNFLGIDFSINLVTNKGAAWGVLSSQQISLQYFRIALICALLVYLFFFNKVPKKDLPLAMITAGAIGNVVDYFIYGEVIDMLHFRLWGYHFPTFNIADSAIFCGVVLFCLHIFFEKRHKSEALS